MASSQTRADLGSPEGERAVRHAADMLRSVVHRLADASVASEADADTLGIATALVQQAADTLSAAPEATLHDPTSLGGGAAAYRARSPFQGWRHPFAQRPVWLPDAAGPEGEPGLAFDVTVGGIFQGPPGAVHGGYVSALFDELLGAVQSRRTNSGGFTGRLEVRYRRPVPIDTPLRFEGWVTADRGRRILVAGRCCAADVLCCDAKALFVRPSERAS